MVPLAKGFGAVYCIGMETYLIQILGLYLVIVGALVLVTRRTLMPAIRDLGKNRGIMIVLGALEIIAGLALVLAYPVVEVSLQGLLALLGYVLIIEGVLYFAAPASVVKKIFTSFNKPYWYVLGGISCVIAGIYLLSQTVSM